MKHWVRLGHTVWRYRRQVVLSVIFGLGAAVLWSGELLLTYPMATVFLEGKTLDESLREESQAAQARLDKAQQELAAVNTRVERLGSSPVAERTRLLKDQSRLQARIDREAWKLWSLSWTATHVIGRLPPGEFQLLLVLFGLLVLTTAVKGLFTYLQDLLAGSVAELCVIDLRAAAFRSLLQRDPQSIAAEGAPRLLAGLTYDLQGLSHSLTTLGGRVVREPLKAIACLSMAFWLNWQLTSLSLLFIPVAVYLFRKLGNRLRRAVHRVLDTMARMYKFLEQCFTNVRVVQAFGVEGQMRREFHRQNRDFYRQSLKIVRLDALTNPLTELLGISAVMVALLPAAYLMLRGTDRIWGLRLAEEPLSVQELTTLYALLAGTIDPLRKFSKYFTTIKQAGTSLERVFRQMDQSTLVPQSPTAVWIPPLRSNLEFRDVHFHYHGSDSRSSDRSGVLHDVSLTFEAGETIALVGPNGSGKSTLLGLLPRFYDPTEGLILLDGIDLREIRLKDLRQQIALVSQSAELFDDTLEANIRYGRPEATFPEVLAAARAAHVDEFAERLPQSWQTPLGMRGQELSGGQRQRVALARAILKNPRILLLDEPTAAIDAQSERWIHASLAEFTRGRTTFLVTHQLGPAVLEYIDRVVVLDRGRVVAVGPHADLWRTCPLYRQLFGVEQRHAA